MSSLRQNKWLAVGLFFICAILLVAYTNELPLMMNYLEVGAFWMTGLLIGAVVGCLAAWLTVRQSSFTDEVARLRTFFAVFFLFLLTSPLLLSWSNRLLASPAASKSIIFESEQARFGSRFGEIKTKAAKPTTHILFFVLDNELYRTSDRAAFFPDASAGDTLSLPIAAGYWGYQWVDRSNHSEF